MDRTIEIEITDEINCRLHNLDVHLRKQLQKKLEFFLPYARYAPAYKLGRWDGMIKFIDVAGRTYVNLLEDIIPTIVAAGYQISIKDHRPTWTFNFPEITEDYFAKQGKVWPEDHTHAGKPVVLRDYQVESCNRYFQNLSSVQVISTGAGKTLLTAALAAVIESHGRTLTIVPSTDLVKQTMEDFVNLGLDTGAYYGKVKDTNNQHIICTWQSLNVLTKKNSRANPEVSELLEFLSGVVAVIVDECFHPDTLVKTPSGYKRICDFEAGDKVINYCEETHTFKEDVVVKRHENLTLSQNEKFYKAEFDDGTILYVTGNHKFLTKQRGWVRFDFLTNTDDIVEYNAHNKNRDGITTNKRPIFK